MVVPTLSKVPLLKVLHMRVHCTSIDILLSLGCGEGARFSLNTRNHTTAHFFGTVLLGMILREVQIDFLKRGSVLQWRMFIAHDNAAPPQINFTFYGNSTSVNQSENWIWP